MTIHQKRNCLCDRESTVPTITDLDLGQYGKYIMYKVNKVPSESCDNEGIRVGDRFDICHDFKPYENGSLAYEYLNLICYRIKTDGSNHVLNFANGIDIQDFLSKFDIKPDIEFAKRRINHLELEIKTYKKRYNI